MQHFLREVIFLSLGKMREQITIIRVHHEKDADGIAHPRDEVVARVRAYYEQRHGSVRWANRARFSDATAMFRFRACGGQSPSAQILEPTYVIVCRQKRFEVLSVENVRGMYLEVLAREVGAVGQP